MNPLEILAAILLGAAVLLTLYRLLAGPTNPDRVVAADTFSIITTVAIAALAALFGSALYLDVALIYGVLAFAGIVALARAIEGDRQ